MYLLSIQYPRFSSVCLSDSLSLAALSLSLKSITSLSLPRYLLLLTVTAFTHCATFYTPPLPVSFLPLLCLSQYPSGLMFSFSLSPSLAYISFYSLSLCLSRFTRFFLLSLSHPNFPIYFVLIRHISALFAPFSA